jgi:glycosyltransferase involved in cell wall biosynthesis
MVDVDVLLTPRESGGHEAALFTWLGDAWRHDGLVPRLLLPGALHEMARQRGLESRICLTQPIEDRRDALAALFEAPRGRPVLLAPGVLHAQAWLMAAAVLARRPVWLYVPMCFRAETMGYRWARQRDRALAPWLGRVEGIVTVDDQQARRLRDEWGVSIPVFSLPNRVSVRGVAPPPPPRAVDGRLRVGYVGRFELHQKGLDWLADTLRSEHALGDAFRWRFQGRGPGEHVLQTLASALGPQRVEIAPFAPIEQALAQVDLLLLPSRYEGMPLVALEATARGWPVVASDRAGLGELLPVNAVFPFGNAGALRDALQSLATPSARRAAVAHARRRLLERLPGEGYHRGRRAVVEALRRAAASA